MNSPYEGQITIDAKLLHALWSYGAVQTVKGVIYPPGSHQECLAIVDRMFRDRAKDALRAPAPSALQPEWQPIKNAPRDRRIEVRYLTDDPRPVQWMATDHGVGWHLANGFGAVPIEFDPTEWRDMVAPSAATTEAPPALQVWYGPMPESNGKSNFTAILHNGELSRGHTIERSEYPERVRYEADLVRWLIGELTEEPFVLDYYADKHSGYVEPQCTTAMSGDPKRWLIVETLPGGCIRWKTFEHEFQARSEARALGATVTHLYATPPSSGNADAVQEALTDAETWCDMQAHAIGNVDGYDYRSGEEAAYRHCAIEMKKRAALADPRNDRGESES